MKKLFLIISAVLFTTSIFSQAPQKMSYQSVIHDTNNNLIKSQQIGMKISILHGSESGTIVYAETQTLQTSSNGLISAEIGNGKAVTGSFSSIDWANGPYYIKTEIDPTAGTNYTITGTSQLLSVPYALYSETSNNSTTSNTIKSGTGEQIVIYTSSYAYAFNSIVYNSMSGAQRVDGYWKSQSLSGTPLGYASSNYGIVIYTNSYAYGIDYYGNWTTQSLSGTPIGTISNGEQIVIYTSSYAYAFNSIVYSSMGGAQRVHGYWKSQSLFGTPIGGTASSLETVIYTNSYAYGFDYYGNWTTQSLSGTPLEIISK